jgi:ribonuclease HI
MVLAEKLNDFYRRNSKLQNLEIEQVDKFSKTEKYFGYFDGASSGNPGKIGVGFAILNSSDEVVYQRGEIIGTGTNNEAEYFALILLLETALKNGVEKMEIFGDSKLVVEQVSGRWKVKAENLKPFSEIAKDRFKKGNFTISWIRRDKNTLADSLSKV